MKFKSFVGMHPVPIVYGMTIGEYGKMINGEKWLENNLTCDLTVIPCENYDHDTPYSLPVPPSPNLRSDVSIQLYPSLCILEATTVTVGRGTDGPFEGTVTQISENRISSLHQNLVLVRKVQNTWSEYVMVSI